MARAATIVVIAALTACSGWSHSEVSPLKMPNFKRHCGGTGATIPASAGTDSFQSCWYSAQLNAMGEPRLIDAPLATGDTILRFTELPSFTHASAVRMERRGGTTTIVTTVIDGGGGYAPGKVLERRTHNFDDAAWSTLRKIMASTALAEQPTNRERPWITLDGGTWIVEVKTANRYQLVVRADFDSDLVQLGLAIKRLAELPARGTVYGHVFDATTRAPLRDARASSLWGFSNTDSSGTFAFTDQIGTSEIQVVCPRINEAIGAYLPVVPVRVARGETTYVDIQVSAHACEMPSYDAQAMTISGYIHTESDHYLLVAEPDSLGHPIIWGGFTRRRRAEVRFSTPVLRNRVASWPVAKASAGDFRDGGTIPCWHVTLHGVLSGPGSYGQFGSANYEFVADSVLRVKPIKLSKCKLR